MPAFLLDLRGLCLRLMLSKSITNVGHYELRVCVSACLPKEIAVKPKSADHLFGSMSHKVLSHE